MTCYIHLKLLTQNVMFVLNQSICLQIYPVYSHPYAYHKIYYYRKFIPISRFIFQLSPQTIASEIMTTDFYFSGFYVLYSILMRNHMRQAELVQTGLDRQFDIPFEIKRAKSAG